MQLTQDQLIRIVEEKQKEGKKWWQIADLLEYSSGEALRSAYRRAKGKHELPAMPKLFNDPLVIPNGTYLVLADIHAPYSDNEFIQDAIENTLDQAYKLDGIIIAGDLVDFDGISQYDNAHYQARLETELHTAGSILMYLAKHAPVWYVSGNHDDRFKKKLNTQFSLQRLVNNMLNGRVPDNEIVATDYDYIFVGSDYLVGHLCNYSKIPGKIAYDIAVSKRRHVLVGHDHIRGVYAPHHAKYVGASIGACTNKANHWYATKVLSAAPEFQKGYALIQDKALDLYDEFHKVYFSRVEMFDGVYNCYRSV